ncbi:unnamed protein product [Haemonchus placei]|uniref:Uncharacterized protein n=1 Tax=Haemonchus placei TaxID=6290 RepID=A0A0N4WYN0_HAEPC|nr:unnamed protein product [Haemonchus placei]
MKPVHTHGKDASGYLFVSVNSFHPLLDINHTFSLIFKGLYLLIQKISLLFPYPTDLELAQTVIQICVL